MKRYFIPVLFSGLLILLVLSTLFAPRYAGLLGNAILAVFLAFALFMIVRHRWRAYQHGEATRSQTFVRIFLDVLGLALAFTLATLLGKLAGDWGAAYGLWVGLLTGCAVCLITSMAVMKVWRVFFR